MRSKYLCGFAGWHPQWLQKFANAKSFMIVYGLLGTTQGMAFLYFIVTLTTIEKRFKIPSGTTGTVTLTKLINCYQYLHRTINRFRYYFKWKRIVSNNVIADLIVCGWSTKPSQMDFLGNDILFNVLFHISFTTFYIRSW